MERRPRAKPVTHAPILFRPMREEIAGVANLLFIAMNSVKVHCAISAAHLNECIVHLVARYGIPKPAGASASVVDGVAALRMLRYARTEMAENLVDADCVDLVDVCIGRFTRIQVAREQDACGLAVN